MEQIEITVKFKFHDYCTDEVCKRLKTTREKLIGKWIDADGLFEVLYNSDFTEIISIKDVTQ